MEVMNGFICRFAKTLYISVCLLWAVACVQPGSRNQTIADQSLQGTQAIDHARIEAGEVCVINTNEREVEKLDRFANSKGYVKKKRRVLEGLGFIMTILETERSAKDGVQKQSSVAKLATNIKLLQEKFRKYFK